ncbi:hypothetical protein DPEC_G00355370 [Dallia pectoralis]|uniref:Uncharacterized protein n=1 Tax=Dallia pectoralis TaxID=75939 RepID=A0ACC2EZI4_DALPE|nr:hypothetical protein DPEC_G00355370 [Dallia pectoralis]
MNQLVVIFLVLFVPTAYSAEGAWCYHDRTCDVTTWPTNYSSFCNGSRQSPINIVSATTIGNVNLTAFTFSRYKDNTTLKTITNNGRTVLVELDSGVQISGGGLSEVYDSLQFHLHWGNGTSAPGSEHTVDDRRYPMEMHIVNTKTIYNRSLTNVSTADGTGIAALSFLIEALPVNGTGSPAAWTALTTYLDNITENVVNITHRISLDDLLNGVDRTKYYRYLGSLTTPNCTEAVVWTVFKDTIKVSQDLINLFSTRLHLDQSSTSELMINNYRKTQASNGRNVTTQVTVSSASEMCFSLGLMAWMLLMLPW